jgi:UDP-glucose 4-epimerase
VKLAGKRVLVTGGAGFIGSHLVDRIIQDKPAHLVVVDNLFLGREENLSEARSSYPGLRLCNQDASDLAAMKRVMEREAIQVVFDLAVIPLPTSLERPRWTVGVNVNIVSTLCELARLGVFETLIHCSSSEVYGSAQYVPMDENHPFLPSTPYAASKAAGDHIVLAYCATFGIDAAIVRPFNNFGPRQNDKAYAGVIPIVIRRALRGDPVLVHGDGEQTRDFIFVRETADAMVRTYEEPATRGQVINIATAQEISVNSLVRAILEILDVDVPILYQAPRPGDVRRHCGAIGRAQLLIGFQPRTTLHQGLVETVEWYKQVLASVEAKSV